MSSLEDTKVSIVDVQATGPASSGGQIIEVAWCRATAQEIIGDVSSSLVSLPRGARITPRIEKLTGIRASDLREAPPPSLLWRDLRAFCDRGESCAPVVAHYARFEQGHLARLHQSYDRNERFPFDLLCTHEIARRLLPELPRRGLHALAGYFGHPLQRRRRAAEHVRATAVVWRELLGILAREHSGVDSLSALRTWMREAPARRTTYVFPLSRGQRLALPNAPGVYRFVSHGDAVLYVGKAGVLRRRVSSHYQRRPGREREKALELLSQVREVQATVTATALEAALLEVEEIAKYLPPYNTQLRPRKESWFLSSDLRSVAGGADPVHRCGPFPAAEDAHALAGLVRLVARESLPSSSRRALRRSLRDPSHAAVEAALSYLRTELPRGRHVAHQVLALGKRAWLLRSEGNRVDEEDDDERETSEHGWAQLERIALRGAQLLRRARWLAWLSEAVVCWSPPERERPRRLVLREGRVALRDDGDLDAALGKEPGWDRALLDRISTLEPTRYDLLRVLTTEIRFLLRQRAPVTLQLRPGRILDGEALSAALAWV